MKRVGLLLGVVLFFVGCGNSPQPKINNTCVINGEKAPDWICEGGVNMKEGIFAVGSAAKSPLGFTFQRNEAIAQARDELARQIGIRVKNMVKTYMSSTGVGDSQTAERVSTQVSKQLSYQVLHGSRLLKMWQSKNGTIYVLVGLNKNYVKNVLKDNIKTTFKNNKALWQEFKAKQAQKELETVIEKEFE